MSQLDNLRASGDAARALASRPALLRLELALFCRFASSAVAMVAYLVAVYAAMGPVGLGLLGAVRMLPAAAVGSQAGPLGRLVGEERLLVAAQAGRLVAGLAATLCVALGLPIGFVLLASGASAAVGSLVRPLNAALLPAAAQTPEELVAANVASSLGEGLVTLLGPAVGGVLVVAGGPALALGAAAAVALAGTVLASAAGATRHEIRRARTRSSLLDAAETLRDRPAALLVIVGFGAQTVVRGLLTTFIVVISFRLLGLGEAGVGWLGAALGLGGFAGALFAVGRDPGVRLVSLFAMALAWWSLPIAFVAVSPVAVVAVVALGIVGFSNAALDVAGYTLLQRAVPSAQRAGVLGLLEGVVGLGIAAGGLLAPALIASLGIRDALVVTGAVLPIVAALMWRRLSRSGEAGVVPAERLAALRRVPLFAPMPLAMLEDLARAARVASFDPGEMLMREGEPGDRYLALTGGAVEVVRGGRVVRTCGPGDGVGEIALLRAVPRSATVRALAPTTAYALDSAAFLSAVTGHDVAAAAAESLVRERLDSAPA